MLFIEVTLWKALSDYISRQSTNVLRSTSSSSPTVCYRFKATSPRIKGKKISSLIAFFISKTHRTVFVNEWNSNVFVSNILFTIFLSYYHKQNSCHSAEGNPGNFRSSIAPYRGTFKENKLSLLSSSTWFSATELDTRSSLVHAVETSSRGEYFGVSEQRGPTSWRCNFLAV